VDLRAPCLKYRQTNTSYGQEEAAQAIIGLVSIHPSSDSAVVGLDRPLTGGGDRPVARVHPAGAAVRVQATLSRLRLGRRSGVP
jgi:hypothetical protein